jgi:8-oxo-dGTP diphosphatase
MSLERYPQKMMAAGCLLRNEGGAFLIVKPTYKAGWEIPGGIIENRESPRMAATRELREELNLELKPGRLLCVDYVFESVEVPERLLFVFDGGVLTDTETAAIRLPADELSAFQFISLTVSQTYLPERLHRRVAQAVHALEHHVTLYLEDQLALPSNA